jgi:hypothetical protein
MKGLTLTQPWASLVALGAKKIETRPWSTSYRGSIAIHAAKGLGPVGGARGLADLCEREPFCSILAAWNSSIGGAFHALDNVDRQRGAIVAVAELVCCVPTNSATDIGGDDKGWSVIAGPLTGQSWPLTDQERAFGDYSPGRYAWLLAEIRPLREPVPCKGALSLWEVPVEAQRQIEAQL